MASKDVLQALVKLFDAKLVIRKRRHVFQGPAWAVLVAYAMFLGAATTVAILFALV